MAVGGLLLYLLLLIVFFYVLYIVIRGAVRAALLDRWKTVRWYELTGEWHDGAWQRRPTRDAEEGPVAREKKR